MKFYTYQSGNLDALIEFGPERNGYSGVIFWALDLCRFPRQKWRKLREENPGLELWPTFLMSQCSVWGTVGLQSTAAQIHRSWVQRCSEMGWLQDRQFTEADGTTRTVKAYAWHSNGPDFAVAHAEYMQALVRSGLPPGVDLAGIALDETYAFPPWALANGHEQRLYVERMDLCMRHIEDDVIVWNAPSENCCFSVGAVTEYGYVPEINERLRMVQDRWVFSSDPLNIVTHEWSGAGATADDPGPGWESSLAARCAIAREYDHHVLIRGDGRSGLARKALWPVPVALRE